MARCCHGRSSGRLLALAAMLGVTLPSYRVICRWSYVLLLLSLALLVAVYFFPPVNNARRWIRFGPIGMQPSEFAKIAYILALARYLMYRENHRRFRGLLFPLAMTLVPVALILREPDLGTALVFLPVFFAVLFAAGARWRDMLGLVLVGAIAMPALWTGMSREQRSRVTALFAQAGPTDPPDDDTYQLRQAKQMLALGGVWGSLLTGQTRRGPGRLPLARGPNRFRLLRDRRAAGALGDRLHAGAFRDPGLAHLGHRGGLARTVRTPRGRRRRGDARRRGVDQHRDDGRAVADHRAVLAAGQLRRLRPACSCDHVGAGAERRHASGLRDGRRTVSVRLITSAKSPVAMQVDADEDPHRP